MSWSEAKVLTEENICNSDGDMLWQISSLKDFLLCCAMTSMLLSHSRHLDLSLPSNVSRFLSICLLMSPSPIALDTPCCTACVIATVMFAVSGWIVVTGIGDCTAVLVLVGANSLFVSPCGGGYPWGGLLLFGGLSLVLLYLLQALVPWFDVLQLLQYTSGTRHPVWMCPCSPHR